MKMENQIIAYILGGKRQGGQEIKTEGESARYMSPQQWLSQEPGIRAGGFCGVSTRDRREVGVLWI